MKIKSTEGDDIEDDHLVGIDHGAQPMRHNHASSIATNLSQASTAFHYGQECFLRLDSEPLAGQLVCSSPLPCPAQRWPRQEAAAEET